MTAKRQIVRLRSFAAVAFALAPPAVFAAAAPETAPAFKLFLSDPGVYRVSYEELAKAGLKDQPETAEMGL